MKTTILYHASCADGFAAALSAWKVLRNEAVYIPVQYNQNPPDFDPCDLLYILDFSYTLPVLQELQKKAKEIVILDHHKTAEADLKDLSDPHPGRGIFARFDMTESGATLAWKFFHPERLVPEFMQLIRDRDLWLWEIEESRAFSAGLASYPFDFQLWDHFLNHEDETDRLKTDGAAILRAQEQRVQRLSSHVRWMEIEGLIVPVVNATSDQSEIGEYLCQQYPDVKFSASFFIRDDGKVVWSLRSRNGFDVSTIAKEYGGGGHAAAAGFVSTLGKLETYTR